jgi:flagellar basal body-associated protein FliL
MKGLRVLLVAGVVAVTLVCPRLTSAGEPGTHATVVAQDPSDKNLQQQLKGVPENVKNLILNFNAARDQFLQNQQALQMERGKAATPAERELIRIQLQANRKQFLEELKQYQDQLRDDLQQLKSKMSHAEFLRVIDAAHGAGTGSRHKGHS